MFSNKHFNSFILFYIIKMEKGKMYRKVCPTMGAKVLHK